MKIAQLLERLRGSSSQGRRRNWTEGAADATASPRRKAGEEHRTIEDQQGLGAGREGDGKPRPF